MILTEQTPTQYVVIVNGHRISMPQSTRSMAEAILLQLPEQQRMVAEIQQITPTGQQVLFG